jgi:hypothetical protein
MNRLHITMALGAMIVLSGLGASGLPGQSTPPGAPGKLLKGAAVPDDPEPYPARSLSLDRKVADVVAYVDVREVKLIDSIGRDADCERNTGSGYCSYLLSGEVKEVFKGRLAAKTLNFHIGTEAGYPTKLLLGEQVVFLIRGKRAVSLEVIENSTRRIEYQVLEKLRKIIDPKAAINEGDEKEPYSAASLTRAYGEADAVVYANVTGFRAGRGDGSFEPFRMKATIREVFKGRLRAGQPLEYRLDLLHRPVGDRELGEQVIFLELRKEAGAAYYEAVLQPEGEIRHGILEKLRKIRKSSR